MSELYRPRKSLAALAVIAATLLTVAGCEERPSADAADTNVEQQTDQTGAIRESMPPAQPGATAVDRDPTPQTGTGGAIPENEEGSSQ